MAACPVVHFEVLGRDREALARFYSELFGWQTTAMPELNYTIVEKAEGGIGGGIGQPQDGSTSWTTFYVQVPDIDATLRAVEERGGRVVQPRMEIPDTVTLAVFQDPEGHTVGLVEG